MPVYSWLASPRETRDVLDRHGLTTKHRLGQNFLISDAIIGKILDLAELHDTDVVFEVGPGIGTLTVAMLPLAGAVVSVEADRSLKDVLAETCARTQVQTPAIIVVGRVVGWCAHRMEELYNAGPIIRPAYKPIFKARAYVPIEERGA